MLRLVAALAGLMLVAATGGCVSTASTTRALVPAAVALQAEVPSMPRVRFWGDELPPALDELIAERDRQLAAERPHLNGKRKAALSFLALSGGGADGAFGAGLLTGWSRSGRRPEFEVVTGISTGALMAPFAFLGPAHDGVLQEVYTSFGTKELVDFKIVTGIFGGPAITENTELQSIIARYVTPELLAAIAREHQRGRRLFVGTTNLDAQRPVVWDLGAIASQGTPEALTLFRNVMLASASVPGLLPPVFIDTVSGGTPVQEMHVDGGTTAEVFFLPPHILRASLRERPKARAPLKLYVVSNGRLGPDWRQINPTAFSIVGRSIDTLLKSQWNSDLLSLHRTSQAFGIDFRLVGVPESFNRTPKETFDKAYMKALFEIGLQTGLADDPWLRAPPRISSF